jgi:ATP-binding cassette subfamily B protein
LHSNLKELICNLLSFIQNGLIDFYQNKLNTSENDFKNAKARAVFKTTAYRSIISLTISLIIGLLTVLIIGLGYKVIIGVIVIGTLFSFEIYTQKLISPIMSLSNISAELSSLYISWERIQLDRN